MEKNKNNFQFAGSSHILFTVDKQSLYMFIRHQDSLRALPFFLVRGVAMGTRVGPSFTCLFVGHMEHSLFQSYYGPHPQLFFRYIDDIIGAASLSHPELLKFINFSSGDRLATNMHCKPTKSHSYHDYISSYPTSRTDSIPLFQYLHLCHICCDEANFDKGAYEMSTSSPTEDSPAPPATIGISLVNLRCTPLRAKVSFLRKGDHNCTQYSSCGLTKALYNYNNASLVL
eukprot:g46699.t1